MATIVTRSGKGSPLTNAEVDGNFTNLNSDKVETSRAVNSGTGLTGGGNLTTDRTLALTGQALALHNLASNGLVARTAADTVAARTLTGPAAGITVTNGDGVSGNPTLALANDLAALEGLSANGLIARTGDGTAAVRTLTGTTDQISVTNGDGVSGNPTIAAVVASQAEAEAGTNTTKLMTPQRVSQAISALGGGGGAINRQQFDASGTWTKPTGYDPDSMVLIQAWGAGGSGSRNSTMSNNRGGGGGGYNERWIILSALSSTETVTIGAGGASRTGSNQAGAAGGDTTFGSHTTAYGGAGGQSGTGVGGGGGGGQLSAGSGAEPGLPKIVGEAVQAETTLRFSFQGRGAVLAIANELSDTVLPPPAAFIHGGGGGGAAASGVGAASVWGGGGGGGGSSGAAGGTSSFGGNGGAAGSTATGVAGSQPGGGGGGATSTSGAGSAGRVIVTVFPG
jgi:hypothetical protein